MADRAAYYGDKGVIEGDQTVGGDSAITGDQTVGGSSTVTGNVKTNGDLIAGTLGGGVDIKEGTNARMGRAVLVAGTKVVSTNKVTANSEVILTSQVDGGTPGWLRISARTAGTSFTILSSSNTDTSTIGWVILEPAS